MLPFIPLICVGGFIASALGLTWYESLPKDQQDEADRLAGNLAWDLYAKSLDQLSSQQLDVVTTMLRDRMN